MLKNAVCITDSRFANTVPLPVFHRENEPFDNRHPAEYENRHILFRRAFSLDRLPGEAVLSISADDYYKLYVNGTFVTQGPAPGYPFHYYYNDIDIATGNFICDGKVVGNIKRRDLKMTIIDKKNSYMW